MQCMWIFVVLLVAASALPVKEAWKKVIRVRRDAATCQPSADVNLDQLFASINQNIDANMFLRPHAYPYISDEVEVNQPHTLNTGEKTCPESVSNDPDAPLNERSLCPWYYNITVLPAGNYPRTIPQAVCRCKNCVGQNLNECQKISTTIRVLEEAGCENGFFIYKRKAILHNVGCMCVRGRVTQPNTTPMCGDFC